MPGSPYLAPSCGVILYDGYGNALTSTAVDTARALDVYLRGIAGTVIIPVSIAGKTCLPAGGTISSNSEVVPAVPGKRIKVFAIEWETAYTGGTIVPILTDGNGGSTMDRSLLQAISSTISGKTKAVSPPGYFFGTTAGNSLWLNPNGQSLTYSIHYFADDAT